MADKNQLLEELNYLTELLSKRSRFLAAGVAVFCWGYVLANITGNKLSGVFVTNHLFMPMALSIMSLLLDIFQYWAGYIQIRKNLHEMEGNDRDRVTFDNSSILFKLRMGAFYGKQILVLVSVFWLLAVIFRIIYA